MRMQLSNTDASVAIQQQTHKLALKLISEKCVRLPRQPLPLLQQRYYKNAKTTKHNFT